MEYLNRLLNVIIIALSIVVVIFGTKVLIDIRWTGVIMEETSPDGKYEVIVSKEKMPEIFERSIDLNTIELYEKKSGRLISYFENEMETLTDCTDIEFVWLEDGIFVKMKGGVWLELSYAECFLSF